MAHAVTPATTTQAIGAVRKGLPAGKLTQMAQLLAVDRALLLAYPRCFPADHSAQACALGTAQPGCFGSSLPDRSNLHAGCRGLRRRRKGRPMAEAAQPGARQRVAPQAA